MENNDTSFDKAILFLKERDVNITSEQTLILALPIIIECIEDIKDNALTGPDKLALALRIMLFVVNESNIDQDKKDVLTGLINGGTLEITIGIIIDASKGKFKFNKKNRMKLLACITQCYSSIK